MRMRAWRALNMSDLMSLDPRTLAAQLAIYDVQPMQTALKTQTATLNAQQAALKSLRSALTDFRTALQALNNTQNGMLKTQATTNMDGVATVTTTSSAQKGTYNLKVDQLASAHQVGYPDLTDEDIASASGTLSLNLGDETLDIDMSEINSLSELASVINKDENNPGITASLVRTGGEVMLMLSSDETGAQNSISVSGDPSAAGLFTDPAEISPAQDATFRMGDVAFTNSSNTLENIIDGVTIELTGVTEGKTLTIRVDTDIEETTTQVNEFIGAYNTLIDTLNTLTASGNGDNERGPFAGDQNIAALERELNALIRTENGGYRLSDFGISADRDGKLKLDSDALTKQLQSDPQSLSAFFNGPDGMIKQMDKSLDKYLNNTDGLLKNRQETLDRRQAEIDAKTDKINTRYDNAYNRYVRQFTQLQQAMVQMNNTMSMFGLV